MRKRVTTPPLATAVGERISLILKEPVPERLRYEISLYAEYFANQTTIELTDTSEFMDSRKRRDERILNNSKEYLKETRDYFERVK